MTVNEERPVGMSDSDATVELPVGVPHVEVFIATRTSEPIGVWCTCDIGRQHTYQEWRERNQLPEHLRDRRGRTGADASITAAH
ncbi:hypothetical protein [Curtobacterium sp. L1-20]|uniref:hypothetical protein n=1 Tax=Curtobacterium sp. L1-20 TaxID=3138181 RepID=UPI003B51C770